MATLKTPGVYVQEVTKFPPSVAPVATAIPAFIGYTEKATKLSDGDLAMTPTRITSMLDYETYFGGADEESGIEVEVTVDNKLVVTNNTPSDFKMYYSLQMYFANGGGPCYVTSVGSYSDTISIGTSSTGLEGGLAAIRKEDEPTLLLFPDGQALSSADFYAINQSALMQCNELQDRFTIIDTYGDGGSAINDLRNGLSLTTDYLKYGAAYYPFLDTILDYQYDAEDVVVKDLTGEVPEDRLSTISGTHTAGTLEDLLTDLEALRQTINTGSASQAQSKKGTVQTHIDRIASYLSSFKVDIQNAITIGNETDQSLADDLSDALDSLDIDAVISSLNEARGLVANQSTKVGVERVIADYDNMLAEDSVYEILGITPLTTPPAPADITIGMVSSIDALMAGEFALLATEVAAESPALSFTVYNLAELETINNSLYNRIKGAISDYPVKLAPSSAMAGIYARVDNAQGVWKAPANVGVSYVQQPTVRISNEEQGDMNVTSSGKSVNAIRTFNGKGTLVWGARTLAGNDNEWRYVSVRRFFNFVEESVSEASEQFVFEPNTANTWVRIRSMIENFLIQQWKAGALAGAKPEEAFYVRVGLGSTMTSQDILEGRMIIEIGMAAVRPAEFIVLRFSHKMQES